MANSGRVSLMLGGGLSVHQTTQDLVSLFLVLAVVSGIALGAVVLVTVWQWLRSRGNGRSGRGVRVPPEGAIGQEPGGAR